MKRWILISGNVAGVFAILTITAATPAAGTIGGAEQNKLLALVRRLGANDFRVREQATKELFRIGLPAKPALLEGAKDPDMEVRRRCRELLPEILEADRQARLAAFVADTGGTEEHNLPGWQRYRKIAGEDAAARKLFVEITKDDTGLLRDAEDDPKHAGEECASLCQNLFQRQFAAGLVLNRVAATTNRQVTLAEMAPLLLVASDPKISVPEEQRSLLFNILYQPASQTALRNRDSSPFKKIVLAWMDRQLDNEGTGQQVFHLVNQLEVREGLDLAVKVIRDRKPKGILLATALTTIGKFGDKQHLPLLEAYLTDKTEIGNFNFGNVRGFGNVQGKTEVRDAALAMLVRLTKQTHKDYGFAISQANYDHLMNYASFLGFGTDEQRTKAFKKWADWKAAQNK